MVWKVRWSTCILNDIYTTCKRHACGQLENGLGHLTKAMNSSMVLLDNEQP